MGLAYCDFFDMVESKNKMIQYFILDFIDARKDFPSEMETRCPITVSIRFWYRKVDSNDFSADYQCQESPHKVQPVFRHKSFRRLQIRTKHNCTRRIRGIQYYLQHVKFVEQEQLWMKLDVTSTEATSIFTSLESEM